MQANSGIIFVLLNTILTESHIKWSSLAVTVCKQFEEKNLVCLRKGLFTVAALDNIDHNPSANTAHEWVLG